MRHTKTSDSSYAAIDREHIVCWEESSSNHSQQRKCSSSTVFPSKLVGALPAKHSRRGCRGSLTALPEQRKWEHRISNSESAQREDTIPHQWQLSGSCSDICNFDQVLAAVVSTTIVTCLPQCEEWQGDARQASAGWGRVDGSRGSRRCLDPT